MNDDITLIVGKMRVSGWTEMRITRGIERLPSDFDISLTELYPGEVDELVVHAGDPCQVKIGNDLVITGYVDKYIPSITPEQHSIRITGRSKCEDLVDCAAIWPNGQISGANVLGIAQKLAGAYNIVVTCDGNPGRSIPQFCLMLGETSFEIIERLCRYAQLLVYDLPDGNLFLSQAGTTRAASGFVLDRTKPNQNNVLAASIEYSMDQRYSDYIAVLQSLQVTSDLGNGGNILTTIHDPGARKPRTHIIVTETGDDGTIAKQRAQWECNRNVGRSTAVRLTADNWRDSAGTLWTPNTLVSLHLPELKLSNVTWLIGEVTYLRDAQGSRAELIIMHPDTFKPEPFLWQPMPRELQDAANKVNPGVNK